MDYIKDKLGFAVALDNLIKRFVFQKNTITGDWRLWHKTIVLGFTFIGSYILLVFFSMKLWMTLIVGLVMIISVAGIGFNVMHDAIHKSYCKNDKLNFLLGLSLNFLGGHYNFWAQKHNIDHHNDTNIVGRDHDINAPGLRMHKVQKWFWYHKLQFIYCWPMYALLYISWIFKDDFVKYLKQRKKMGRTEKFIFWAFKIFYWLYAIVIPVLFIGFKNFIIGYAIICLGVGLYISIIFQLAHIVVGAAQPTERKRSKLDWLLHQLQTTSNFATNSAVCRWLFGGLTHQVEHHLKANMSHIHYHELSKQIKVLCKEYDQKYNEYKTFLGALWSHAKMMYLLGNAKSLRRS